MTEIKKCPVCRIQLESAENDEWGHPVNDCPLSCHCYEPEVWCRYSTVGEMLEEIAKKMPVAKAIMVLSFDLWDGKWQFNIPKPKTKGSGTSLYSHDILKIVQKAWNQVVAE